MKVAIIFFLVLSPAVSAFAQQESATVDNLTIEQFREVMDSLDNEVVVDLRTPDELKQGKIPGAVVIDFFGPDFEPKIQELDRNKVYLLYCASGGRSGETAELMTEMGFRHVYNVGEGFNGWIKRKLPVEPAGDH